MAEIFDHTGQAVKHDVGNRTDGTAVGCYDAERVGPRIGRGERVVLRLARDSGCWACQNDRRSHVQNIDGN